MAQWNQKEPSGHENCKALSLNGESPRQLAAAHPQVVTQFEMIVLLPKLRELPFGSWSLGGNDVAHEFSSILLYDLNVTIELKPLWSQEFNCLRWVKYQKDAPIYSPPLLTTMAHVRQGKELVVVLPVQAFSFEALLHKAKVASTEIGRYKN